MLGAKINSATGGTISSITGYVVHTFSSSGTFTPTGSGPIEVLVIGGGGGRSPASPNGGAGGGSVLYQKFVPVLSGVSYPMSVGTKGSHSVGETIPGGNTVFVYNGGTITAPGGAGGASPTGSAPGIAKSNPLGSGGGGTGGIDGGAVGLGANIIGYGFSGGPAASGGVGGGGGAGGAGDPSVAGGNGGIGVSYSITGSSTFYGGGGGGSAGGASTPIPSFNNFGYGGGATSPNFGSGGAIIIRYPS
jgi:hypothetical protein